MRKQIGSLQTEFGERLHVDHQGELVDKTGQRVGSLRLDDNVVRFEIAHATNPSVSGVIRGADAVVPHYMPLDIPATIKIGQLLDDDGQPLTAAMLIGSLFKQLTLQTGKNSLR